MRNWIIVVVLAISLFGGLIIFFSSNGEIDAKYNTPDEVKNRPEVEAQILKMYPHSKRLQIATLEFARQFQVAITFPEAAREIYQKRVSASNCFSALVGPEPYIQSRKIEALVVNTYERSKAYIKYNAKLSGYSYVVTGASLDDCHFDVNSLEN